MESPLFHAVTIFTATAPVVQFAVSTQNQFESTASPELIPEKVERKARKHRAKPTASKILRKVMGLYLVVALKINLYVGNKCDSRQESHYNNHAERSLCIVRQFICFIIL